MERPEAPRPDRKGRACLARRAVGRSQGPSGGFARRLAPPGAPSPL